MEEETDTQNNDSEKIDIVEIKPKKRIPWGTIVVVLIIIVAAFLAINYSLRPRETLDCDVMCCIGNNSILFASTGCSHCINQIKLLGDSIENFTIIYCDKDTQACIDAEIMGVPTWIINGEKYVGTQSLDKLKELTGC